MRTWRVMPAKRARRLELPNELAMQDNQGRGMSAERSVEESGVQRRAKGLCGEGEPEAGGYKSDDPRPRVLVTRSLLRRRPAVEMTSMLSPSYSTVSPGLGIRPSRS